MAALRDFVVKLAGADSLQALRQCFLAEAGSYFEAQHWGIHVQDQAQGHTMAGVQGNPDTAALKQTALFATPPFAAFKNKGQPPDFAALIERLAQAGQPFDPIVQSLVDRHAPAHDQMLPQTDDWRQSELYRACFAAFDHGHMLMGPIVGEGRLLGFVHFTREQNRPAFDERNLADLAALCAHLSACLARLTPPALAAAANGLTARERQIANLVAQGLTNAQIASSIWITENSVKQALKRMFRKLAISSRAELVALLPRSG
ncbi:helix-turn-helix transcriptional regulator [Gloeobacter kilaueensis]|uniref:LuxR family transcriptional regulator n=1 Tax=Gloeobacter kilaueensis (strain ATCC BAA-2537 / CCAP 1431/1 / ULC 316 / JS1) TaxID=1183438 RepID=U5QK27_GLOK1|nr:helix-turn-helix transcriptional regulator [Gloeobacter kilaueensis]AGY59248.1 LuxR family transcriptional regulator [Gloeobacter kilaueensis JS1]